VFSGIAVNVIFRSKSKMSDQSTGLFQDFFCGTETNTHIQFLSFAYDLLFSITTAIAATNTAARAIATYVQILPSLLSSPLLSTPISEGYSE